MFVEERGFKIKWDVTEPINGGAVSFVVSCNYSPLIKNNGRETSRQKKKISGITKSQWRQNILPHPK